MFVLFIFISPILLDTGAVSEFNAPVIIGAPPPHDGTHAKARQMYGNNTFDFGGPERLPPSTTKVATRIKQKRVPKATHSDPIVVCGNSSDDSDGAPCIIPAKKKGKAAKAGTKGKKRALVLLDSSDDEVDVVDSGNADAPLPVLDADDDENVEEDYQGGMESRKRKAKNLPAEPGRVGKKPNPAINQPGSKKGNERKRPTNLGAKKLKSAKYVEVSDSDTDETVKGNVGGEDLRFILTVGQLDKPLLPSKCTQQVRRTHLIVLVSQITLPCDANNKVVWHQKPHQELCPGYFYLRLRRNLTTLSNRPSHQAHLRSIRRLWCLQMDSPTPPINPLKITMLSPPPLLLPLVRSLFPPPLLFSARLLVLSLLPPPPRKLLLNPGPLPCL